MQLLTINGARFRLPAEELSKAMKSLAAAAFAGGGFVDLTVEGDRTVSVWVSQSSSMVAEEERPAAVAVAAECDQGSSWLDEV